MKAKQFASALTLPLLVIALVAAYILFVAKEDYPFERTLTDRKGRSVEVILLGRTGDTLHFNRVADGQRYELSIDDLATRDRLLAFRYPQGTPPPPPKPPENLDPKESDPYITGRMERIRELEEKREVFLSELKSGTLSESLQRNRIDQLEDLEKEIREMQTAIESYRYRTRR